MKDHVNSRIDEVMQSIDQMQPASPSPHFKAKVLNSISLSERNEPIVLLKPILLMAATALLILMNTAMLLSTLKSSTDSTSTNDVNNLTQFSKEYHLTNYTNNFYDVQQ
jgi:hypothetical protein